MLNRDDPFSIATGTQGQSHVPRRVEKPALPTIGVDHRGEAPWVQENARAALPTQTVVRNSILLENLRQRLLRA